MRSSRGRKRQGAGYIRRKTAAIALLICLMSSIIGGPAPRSLDGAVITVANFNPVSQYLEISFTLQYGQNARVEIWKDGSVADGEFEAGTGVLVDTLTSGKNPAGQADSSGRYISGTDGELPPHAKPCPLVSTLALPGVYIGGAVAAPAGVYGLSPLGIALGADSDVSALAGVYGLASPGAAPGASAVAAPAGVYGLSPLAAPVATAAAASLAAPDATAGGAPQISGLTVRAVDKAPAATGTAPIPATAAVYADAGASIAPLGGGFIDTPPAAGEPDLGPGHHTLRWDGHGADGRPVLSGLGENRSQDLAVIEVRIIPEGRPDLEGEPSCYWEDNDPGPGQHRVHVPENHATDYLWTAKPEFAQSVTFLLDYKNGAYLAARGGMDEALRREMLELFYAGASLQSIIAGLRLYLPDLVLNYDCGDPVNMIDGAYYFSYTDLRLESDSPLSFARVYNSVNGEDMGLGRGFSHGYHYRLRDDRGAVTVTTPMGEDIQFLLTDSGAYHGTEGGAYSLERRGGGYLLTHNDTNASLIFDSAGLLTQAKNPVGKVVCNLTYGGGRLTTLTSGAGSFTIIWAGDHISSVRDSAGRAITYGYSGNNLISYTNPDGDSLSYDYDANGVVTACRDFSGRVYLTNTNDERGRVTRQEVVTSGGVSVYAFTYDDTPFGGNDPVLDGASVYPTSVIRVNSVTLPDGRVYSYHHNKYRQILKVVEDNGESTNLWEGNRAVSRADKDGGQVTYTMDDPARGDPLAASYRDGGQYQYAYNARHQITSISYPGGGGETLTYNSDGGVTRRQDGDGLVASYGYNGGALASVTNGLGQATTYAYDNAGRLIKVTDGSGRVVTYSHDSAGRVTKVTVGDGGESAETSYTYSAAGKLLSQTDGEGNQTTYRRTPNGYLETTTYPNGATESIAYGVDNQILSQTDIDGQTTSYSYDSLGRLSREERPGGYWATYTYDSRGRLATESAPAGITTYEYDAMDRLIARVPPLGEREGYTYDQMGRLLTAGDRGGGATSYAYDALGRLTEVADRAGGV
ncbi:MAG: DUF6531 domain-containing protein, partial [Peptococcaceae bacterium]|nr:DUF6531 domain-containing protein [Peptococcaceae bacterium]